MEMDIDSDDNIGEMDTSTVSNLFRFYYHGVMKDLLWELLFC